MSDPGRTGRLVPTLAVLLVGGGLLLGHLEVMARGPGYAGPLLVLDHVFSLAAAAGLLALAAALGRRLLALFGVLPDRRVETLLFSTAVGVGGLALLFLLLGAVALLSGPALALTCVAVGLVARRELSRGVRELGPTVREIRERAGDGWLLGGAVVSVAVAGAFLLVHGAAPPGDWDSLMYHLEIPRRWLARGEIFLPPDNLHAAYVGVVHLLYLPLLALGSASAPALLNGFFALLLALGVFSTGQRLFDGRTGAFSALVLWATTGLLIVASTARIDVALLYFLLLGHAALLLALRDPSGSEPHLVRAGLVLGLAAGVKYHALPYTLALVPIGALVVWWSADRVAPRLRSFLVAVGPYLVAAAPWFVLTFLLVGAPLYPFFVDRMLPPWLAELYGSSGIPSAVDPASLGVLGDAREPFDLVSYFTSPERLTVEPEGRYYDTNLLLLLLPLWLLHLRSRAVTGLVVPALLYGAVVIVPFDTTNLRYLFPAMVPLTVATAYMGLRLLDRLPSARQRGVALVVGGLLLVPAVRSGTAWTRKAPVLEHAVGAVSPQAYLAQGFPFYAGFVSAVNRNVPEDGEVLMLWEARGFHLAPRHLQDNVLTNWPLLVPYVERTGSCLEESRVTHLLVSSAAVRYYTSRGSELERTRWERFGPFRERCLSAVEEGAGWTLYRLDPG